MKTTSPLRRWLREERGRERAEACDEQWRFIKIGDQAKMNRVMQLARAAVLRHLDAPALTAEELKSGMLERAVGIPGVTSAAFDGDTLALTVIRPPIAEHITCTIGFNNPPDDKT